MNDTMHAQPGANPRSYNGHYMQVGKAAEQIIMQWLKDKSYIIGVEDLRSLRPMREADVDVSLSLWDGRVALAEIKSDYHLGVSGNVLIEVLRINHTAPPDRACTLGWTLRSPANWLLYYAPQVNKIYQCRFDDLRKSFQSYTQKKRKQTRIDYVVTDAIKSTVNVLIPFSECADIFTIHELGGA